VLFGKSLIFIILISFQVYTGGYKSVQPEKVQQIALYYLAHQISMAQIGDKFDVATSTVFNCINTWKMYFKIGTHSYAVAYPKSKSRYRTKI